MSEKPKTVHYRKCILTDGQNCDASDGKNLQQLIREATKSLKQPWRRKVGVSGNENQLLTASTTKNGCICGELVYYEQDRHIPLVDVESDGRTWQQVVVPNDSSGRRRNLQETAFYFAVRENHVGFIQSTVLNASKFEGFLTWLIQSEAGQIPNALISLKNIPARSAIEKLKDHKIRGIQFGERLFTTVRDEIPPAAGEPARKRKRYVQRIETSPRILGVLSALGLSDSIIEKLEQEADPGAIDVEVDISYRSRSEREGVAVLRSLADTLGKQEGLETTIRLSGKSKIKGSELTISDSVEVQCPLGNISGDDAMTKLSRWLMEQIQASKVT